MAVKRGTYKIKFDKETLAVFIREIYKDVFMAIPRETIQNAVDSYIEANKYEGTIVIRVPSTDNLVYAITDYGIGIDDVRWESIFCKLFRSTKDYAGTELLGGFFGLGSKSPFIFANKIIYKITYDHELVIREQYSDLSYKIIEQKQNVSTPIETIVEVPIDKEKLLSNLSTVTGLSGILVNKLLETKEIEPIELAVTIFNYWLAYYALGVLYLPYDFKVIVQTDTGTYDLQKYLQAKFYKGYSLVKANKKSIELFQKTLELVLPNKSLSSLLVSFTRDYIAKGKMIYPIIVGTLPYPNIVNRIKELTPYINKLQEKDIAIVLPKNVAEITPDREAAEIVSDNAEIFNRFRQNKANLLLQLKNRDAIDKKDWTDKVLMYYITVDDSKIDDEMLDVLQSAYDRTIVIPNTVIAELKQEGYNVHRNNQLLKLLGNMSITIDGLEIEIGVPKSISNIDELFNIVKLYKIELQQRIPEEIKSILDRIVRYYEIYNGDFLTMTDYHLKNTSKLDILYWPTLYTLLQTAYENQDRIIQIASMKELKTITKYLSKSIAAIVEENTLQTKYKNIVANFKRNGIIDLLAIQSNKVIDKFIVPVVIPKEEVTVIDLQELSSEKGQQLYNYVAELVQQFKTNYDEILAALLFKIDHYAIDIPILQDIKPKVRLLTPKSTINLFEDLTKVQGKTLSMYPIFRWANVYKLLEALTF